MGPAIDPVPRDRVAFSKMRLKKWFPSFSEFMRDAGLLGVGSEVAAVIFFGVSFYEHAHGSAVTSNAFVGASVLSFWFGAYLAWMKKRNQIAGLVDERDPGTS